MDGTTANARYQRLQLVTDAALAHLELEELLAELLARIRAALEVDTCAILLLDEPSNELVARAAVGIEEEVERGVRIPVGRGFAGRIAAEARAVVIEDVDHADVLNPILHEKGIKTLLGVPLMIEGRVTGVLHVGSLTPRVFDAEDVELLQLVGDRAALAIAHANVYEAERRARLRVEHVQAVADAAIAHLELDDLLQALLHRIRAVLEADTAAILLRDPQTNELVARAALGIEAEVEQGVRIPFGVGFAGRVAADRRPVVIEDVDHADIYNPILREKGIKTLLGVPLVANNSVIGVLHVGTLVPRRFDAEDVHLLQLVAERVAIAIERSRLHEEAVRLNELKLNFVAVASHELRTPATAVYGALATLRARRDELQPAVREQLEETAWLQSDRMRRLIEQLLDLSRLDAKSVAVRPEQLALRPLLVEIAAAESEANVELDVDPGLTVHADPLVVDRIVSNLVGNARIHGKPPIRIEARLDGRTLHLAVEDGGPGAALGQRMFERFERGPGGHGSGLGLAVARAYAQAHGGSLDYDESASRTRFELTLPGV